MTPAEDLRAARLRLLVIAGIIGLALAGLAAGLAWRQLLQRDAFVDRERMQNQRRILVPGPRGRILDREGRALVDNRAEFILVAHLSELRPAWREARTAALAAHRAAGGGPLPPRFDERVRGDWMQARLDEFARLLGRPAQPLPRLAFERHLRSQLLLPYPVLTGLTPPEMARLVEHLAPGEPFRVAVRTRRTYPFGPLAAHTLGYVQTENEATETEEFGDELMTFARLGTRGAAGLELAFDETLRGRPGGEIWLVDPAGRQVREIERREPERGGDVRTSIDAELQRVAEQELRGQTGAVVAVEVATGEVLVLASAPGFDLEAFERERAATIARMTEEGAWLHRAVQGLYPPGSTFKLMTALAGLEGGSLRPAAVHVCTGAYPVGSRVFPCNRTAGHGEVDLREALRASCNVFFYHYGLLAGVDQIAQTARQFRLHEPTGIELPSESRRMIVPGREWKQSVLGSAWFAGDTANLAIGQGYLRCTPLQVGRMIAGLAKGDPGLRLTLRHRPGPRPPAGLAGGGDGAAFGLAPGDWSAVLEGMERAVERGTARLARLPGLRVAGKTGTAQQEDRGGTLNFAWFVGFAPADRPEIAVAVVVEGPEPDVEFAGGLRAAPIAREVLAAALRPAVPAQTGR